MRVTGFGANGATGRHIVDYALAYGHHVTAFVKHASRLGARSEQLTIVVGDVAEAAVVASAVEGRHGVLCALGAAIPLRRELTLVEGMRHIVSAMEQHGARRLVYLSFLAERSWRPRNSASAARAPRSCRWRWRSQQRSPV